MTLGRRLARWGAGLGAAWVCWGAQADPVVLRVAAASNLHTSTPALQQAWAVAHPDIELAFSHAATGSLVAQIRHGAPFDVLLAADMAYPRALVQSGHALDPAPQLYAHGQLLLWPAPVATTPGEMLRSNKLRHVAVAQPRTAPYGRAARDWLQEQGLWAELTDKIVYGENVAQALQLAASGHADACVIAASLAVGQPDLKAGLLLPLPADSLPHGAIVLRRTKHPEAARTFLKWLDSAAARRILQTHGYRLP